MFQPDDLVRKLVEQGRKKGENLALQAAKLLAQCCFTDESAMVAEHGLADVDVPDGESVEILQALEDSGNEVRKAAAAMLRERMPSPDDKPVASEDAEDLAEVEVKSEPAADSEDAEGPGDEMDDELRSHEDDGQCPN